MDFLKFISLRITAGVEDTEEETAGLLQGWKENRRPRDQGGLGKDRGDGKWGGRGQQESVGAGRRKRGTCLEIGNFTEHCFSIF